ncbi:unnamed protein product, partial [marine sediment metagenome]
ALIINITLSYILTLSRRYPPAAAPKANTPAKEVIINSKVCPIVGIVLLAGVIILQKMRISKKIKFA